MEFARLTGHPEDVDNYRTHAEVLKKAYNKRFSTMKRLSTATTPSRETCCRFVTDSYRRDTNSVSSRM